MRMSADDVVAAGAKIETMAITTYWSTNGGAAGDWTMKYLMPGETIDGFGSIFGKYFSPMNTPMTMRGLPPSNTGEYTAYRVLKPFHVQSSIIAPVFGEIGGGIQYLSPVNAKTLLKRDIITPIK